MKVIDLLNKIANGEKVPNEIKHWNKNYRYDSLSTHYEQIEGFDSLFRNLLIYEHNLQKCLNEEVEIIEEEKEIEEIDICTGGIMGFDGVENITGALKDKINELVREVRKLKEK